VIEDTEWAKLFKRDCPSSYDQAIKFASRDDVEVAVELSEDTGEQVFAIILIDDSMETGFWLDAFDTKDEAIALCVEMNWRIVE
jgi:hypothetical protein